MKSFYDRADIYDLFENEQRYEGMKKHWQKVFDGKEIKSLLDVSIGSGSTTLPVLDLGVTVSGSDLSTTMLENCRKKLDARGVAAPLKECDFRDLSAWGTQQFDVVASTGNSLAYVSNDDVIKTLKQMDCHVAPGGYLYFDSRNWDKILSTRQRFYFYNPLFKDENRINVIQVWDYNTDGSMLFNIVYTFEKDNKLFQKEIFEEHYHPISKQILLDALTSMGYTNIEQRCYPAFFESDNLDNVDWYCVLAKKE